MLVAAAEQLALQRHQAAQVLLAGGLGGGQHDAGLQEILHPPQQVLAALGQVGVAAENLRGRPGMGVGLPRSPRGDGAPWGRRGARGWGHMGGWGHGAQGHGGMGTEWDGDMGHWGHGGLRALGMGT